MLFLVERVFLLVHIGFVGVHSGEVSRGGRGVGTNGEFLVHLEGFLVFGREGGAKRGGVGAKWRVFW